MKNYLLFIGALALFSLNHSFIHAQAGFLDPTFGTDGTAFQSNPNRAIGACNAIALTPDGKIVAGGSIHTGGTGSSSVIRFTSNGELDNTFGVRGVQDSVTGNVIAVQADGKILVDGFLFGLNRITANGQFDEGFIPTPYSYITPFLCKDLLTQPDGKILRAGNLSIGEYMFRLKRYLTNGAPDKSFGAQGSVNTDFPEAGEYVRDILLQPDGKILAIGGYSPTFNSRNLLVARYNSNGTLDNSYGTNGVTKASFGGLSGEGYSAALTTDGKLLVGGTAGTAIALIRLDASGKPDATFGNNGVVISDLNLAADQEIVHTLLLRPDGKILVCGRINMPDFHPFCVQFTADGDKDDTFDATGANLPSYLMDEYTLIRMALKPDGKVVLGIFTNDFYFNILQLSTSGQPDMGFGKSGRANAAFDSDSRAVDVAILPDDRVLVLGGIDNCIEPFNDDIVLTRFSSDGKPDVTFGVQGKISDSPTPAGKNYPGKLSLQADGKILVTNAYAGAPGDFRFTLLRYLPEGTRDSAFGTNGVVFFNGTYRFYSPDVIEQPDGKILFLVNLLESTSSNAVLYRLLPSGAIDSTFATNGALKIDVSSGHDLGLALALQPDGKIIVAGNFQKPGNSSYYDIFIDRYLPDGTPDDSFGASGRAVPALGSIDTNPVCAILLQPDGNLLLCGQIKYSSTSDGYSLLLLRFTPKGILDQSFGIDGVVTTDWYTHQSFSGLALQPDGRIVTCGSGWLKPSNDFYINIAQQSLLIRYNQDGSPDNTFGVDGHSSGYFNSDGMFYYSSVALQSSGRIVAAGAASRGYTLNLGIAGFASGIVDSPEAREGSLEARISPNPTKDLLRVEYTLENPLSCTLGIYDVNGKLVRSVFSGTIKPAGLHEESIALADLSAGLYFVRLEAGARVFAGKFLRD